jgi:hypothetical protein
MMQRAARVDPAAMTSLATSERTTAIAANHGERAVGRNPLMTATWSSTSGDAIEEDPIRKTVV